MGDGLQQPGMPDDGHPDIAKQNTPLQRHRVAFETVLRVVVIGALTGLVAVAFRLSLSEADGLRRHLLSSLHDGGAPIWWLVPGVVGIFLVGWFVGWMVQRIAPESGGSGIPRVEAVIAHDRAMRWWRVLPVKFVGGVLAIGGGLSLGREGPTVQMGAAVAQAVCGLRSLTMQSLHMAMACGAGAGLAAAFNAPLSGIAFILEEMRRTLDARWLLVALLTSTLAVVMVAIFLGDVPIFGGAALLDVGVTGTGAGVATALTPALVVGVVGGVVGAVFNTLLVGACRRAGRTTPRLRAMLPGFACVLAAVIAWWLPEATGDGLSVADRLLSVDGASAGFLAALAALGMALTIVSYASGAPGGIFAPLLLLGCAAGMLLGHAGIPLERFGSPSPALLGVLGMTAVFTASVRAPMTGIVLVVEMTRNVAIALPLCVAAAAAYVVAGLLHSRPVYESLLELEMAKDEPSSSATR